MSVVIVCAALLFSTLNDTCKKFFFFTMWLFLLAYLSFFKGNSVYFVRHPFDKWRLVIWQFLGCIH